MLIYVVSVLMILYLLLFISALGKKKTPAGAPKGSGFDDINQPLIHQPEEATPRYKTSFSHNKNNMNNVVRSPMMSGDRDDFVPINYHDRSASSSHYTGQSRGKSFTEIVENITQRLSISIRAEEFDQGNDEIAPLRTMSVA
jgi:hypothetical protein